MGIHTLYLTFHHKEGVLCIRRSRLAPEDASVRLDEVVDADIRLVRRIPHHGVIVVVVLWPQDDGLLASQLRYPHQVADAGRGVANAAQDEGATELVDDGNPGLVREMLFSTKHTQRFCGGKIRMN